MVDPGAVGSDQSQGQNRHWLINGATIVGEFSFHAHRQNSNRFLPDNALNFDNATTITAYAGPAPPSGSGPHRLVDSAAHLPLPLVLTRLQIHHRCLQSRREFHPSTEPFRSCSGCRIIRLPRVCEEHQLGTSPRWYLLPG